ncbi:MAG: V-type ATP synthase subunit E family protein [Candidatus Omnitrophota bacterium]
MADQIKELIEKIQAEGVQAAQDKAAEIETEARRKADWIVQKATAQAQKIVDDAQETVSRMQASGQAALQQSGRDVLLTLKKEIVAMLQRVIASQIAAALTPEELSRILTGLIQVYCSKNDTKIVVYLKEQDRQSLEGNFLNRLKDELKKDIELRVQGEINAGLVISFDAGKSQFDFTDKALAEYIGSFLKPAITALLNGQKR